MNLRKNSASREPFALLIHRCLCLSESIRAAAKITEYSLEMLWEPWLGGYNKRKME
jgi:hypothetical protein